MTFTVDQEKKRTWLRGWWRDRAQGKVLLALSVIGLVSMVLLLPSFIEAVQTMLALSHIQNALERSDAASASSGAVLKMSVAFVLAVCGIPVFTYPRRAAKAFSAESLTIEDGCLRWIRHDNSRSDELFEVSVCRLSDCAFHYDEKRRLLVVKATRPGAVAGGMAASAAAALSARAEGMTAFELLEFWPYFSPDPVQALRDLGVREES